MANKFQLGDRVKYSGVTAIVISVATGQLAIGITAESWPKVRAMWPLLPDSYKVTNAALTLSWENCRALHLEYGYFVMDDDVEMMASAAVPNQGCHCKKCGNHFPFAEPNQDDGTLVCWNCRNYPHYKGRL